MGNCMKSSESLIDGNIPRGIGVDCTPIKQSGLPIIFIIGGPSVGKRTIAGKVAQKYGFYSIITADVLRTEVSTRTDRAFALARLMSQGRLVPSDIMVELITIKMLDNMQTNKGFIVSGFPRGKHQGKVFDEEVRPPDLVIFLDVRNSVLSDRMMARSVLSTSRLTVNFEYIKSHIKEFHKRNKPVVMYYKKVLVVVDGEYDMSTVVFENVCKVIDNTLVNLPPHVPPILREPNPVSTVSAK